MIVIGGVRVDDLVAGYGSPVFALDEEDFRGRARAYARAFVEVEGPAQDAASPEDRSVDVYYAAKSFLATRVAQWLDSDGLRIDVCTGGELACALRAGVPAAHLLLHGNNKSDEELRQALVAGVGRIVIDSDQEIDRLVALAAELGVRPKVLIRVTVGVEAHTHEFIATAHEDQKFGFSLASGAAESAAVRILGEPGLELVGLHSHIGSQIFVTSGFEVAAHRVVGLMKAIQVATGVTLAELDLGGGLGIRYTDDDDPPVVADVAQTLFKIVAQECVVVDLPMPRLAFEPGRAISGPAMVTVYRVGTVKDVDLDNGATRRYVSVDGGMSDNIRTALYDADYTVRLASRVTDAGPVLCRVVGKHCESGDIVVRDAWLPADVRPGDLLAVAATGAYNRSMASNYNLVPKPAVVAVRDGRTEVVLRRESEADLFALDPGFASQQG